MIQGLEAGEEGVGVVEQLLDIMFSVLKEDESTDKPRQPAVNTDTQPVPTGDKKKLTLLLKQVNISDMTISNTSHATIL